MTPTWLKIMADWAGVLFDKPDGVAALADKIGYPADKLREHIVGGDVPLYVGLAVQALYLPPPPDMESDAAVLAGVWAEYRDGGPIVPPEPTIESIAEPIFEQVQGYWPRDRGVYFQPDQLPALAHKVLDVRAGFMAEPTPPIAAFLAEAAIPLALGVRDLHAEVVRLASRPAPDRSAP